MSSLPANMHPAAARSLAYWHQMVEAKDLSDLNSILHPAAIFRSPMAATAYATAPALVLALTTVMKVFEDFTYHRQLSTDDGMTAVLEFSARVGDKKLKGIDFIAFNHQGLITDFEVMVRPMSGLQALGAEMGSRLSDLLPAYKSKL